MGTQAGIVRAFSEGKLEDFESRPVHIETPTSHVFVCGDAAYKLYKDDSGFFNDNYANLSDRTTRLEFIRSDFAWNRAVTPAIYRELKGVSVADGSLIFSDDLEQAEHVVICMRSVDTTKGLLPLLSGGALTEQDFLSIGRQLSDRLSTLPKPASGSKLRENFRSRMKDMRVWMTSLSDILPREEALGYVDYLEQFVEGNEIMLSEEYLSSCADIHCENALYADGTLQLIDTFPPKEEWRIGHQDFDVYRLAGDVYVMAGEEGFRAVLRGYEEQSGRTLDPALKNFFVVYVVSIMVPYLYFISKESELHRKAAVRYRSFLREYFAAIAR